MPLSKKVDTRACPKPRDTGKVEIVELMIMKLSRCGGMFIVG